MYNITNEITKIITPLSDMISANILKIASFFDFVKDHNDHNKLMKIAKELQIEYPNESIEYISLLIKRGI